MSIKGFEGGQMPIHRRLPKRGFTNIFRKKYVEVNLGRLQVAIDDGKLDAKKPVDVAALIGAGVISKARDGVRILGKGELKAKNIEIHAAGASKSAIAAVEAAGGKIVLPAGAAPGVCGSGQQGRGSNGNVIRTHGRRCRPRRLCQG